MLIHLKLFIYIHILNHTFGVLILFTYKRDLDSYTTYYFFLPLKISSSLLQSTFKLNFRETKLHRFNIAVQELN